ncbi:MAG: glycosyltransferase [Pseudomonadota bacterium]
MSPLSIILPYRDAADTLAECLDSIRLQEYGDFEVLAIDDHSSDDSKAVVAGYAQNDPRIRPLDNPGRGLVPALNHGLAVSRGDIVARMDADDIMHPGRLRRHREHFAGNPRLALSATRVRLIPEGSLQAGFREYLRWQNNCVSAGQIRDEIYIESPFAHPSVAFRRDLVAGLGGYRDGPFPEDYDLWLRLNEAGHRMEKITQVLLDWRDSAERLTRSDTRYRREAFDHLRARHLARDPRVLRNARRLVIWGAGRRTRRRADLLLAQGFRPRAWIDIDPRKIGNRVNGIPVMAPDSLARNAKAFVLVYVTNHGARDLIALDLETMGYRRGSDYLMVG